MEYRKTMYLLSLLYAGANDTNRKRIGDLFKEAVIRTEEYDELKKLLQTVTFLGKEGIEKQHESELAIEKALTEISNASVNIKQMELCEQQIKNEITKSETLLVSPRFFDEDLVAVKSEKIDIYNKFYKMMANSICYYLVSQFGVKNIRNLTFNYRAGFQEIVKLLNQQYSNELAMSIDAQKPLSWSISKTYYGEDNLIEYEGFKIIYSHLNYSQLQMKVNEGEYFQASPNLFIATSSAVGALFTGIGNIVGVEIGHAISLLDAEIVSKLPISAFENRDINFSDILNEIKKTINTDCYCISPEDLVAALNRWSLNKTVTNRKKNGACIACGKPITSGRIACDIHINIS